MEPAAPAPNPVYSVLVIKGIAAVTAIMDATRCVYDSVEAKEVSLDAGLDFAADAGEIMLMYLRLQLANPYGEPGVIVPGGFENYTKDFSRNKTITKTIAAICYGIVYGTWALINALEQLNGWGEPDTGNAFTPDCSQSKVRLHHPASVGIRKSGPIHMVGRRGRKLYRRQPESHEPGWANSRRRCRDGRHRKTTSRPGAATPK